MSKSENKKKMPLFLKIPAIGIGSIVGIFVVAWGGINIFKYPFFCDFYNSKINIGPIPGINDGMVQQGITTDSSENIIVSTYRPDKAIASRLYYFNSSKKTNYVNLLNSDGSNFVKHTGGVQFASSETYGDYMFIADAEQGVYCVKYDELFKNASQNKAFLNKCIPFTLEDELTNECSYIFSDDVYLYIGEFNNNKSTWKAHNKINKDGIEHSSVIFRFNLDDFIANSIAYQNAPEGTKFVYPSYETYSIRDNVQGCAFVDDTFYLSCSYSISISHLYTYDLSKASTVTTEKYGDVHFVNEVKKDMWLPPMSEDLDVNSDGKLITLSESASDKYVFGKLFFAFNIWSITI